MTHMNTNEDNAIYIQSNLDYPDSSGPQRVRIVENMNINEATM